MGASLKRGAGVAVGGTAVGGAAVGGTAVAAGGTAVGGTAVGGTAVGGGGTAVGVEQAAIAAPLAAKAVTFKNSRRVILRLPSIFLVSFWIRWVKQHI